MVALSVEFPQLTALLGAGGAGATAEKARTVVAVPALAAAGHASGAIVRRHLPLEQEPSPHAPDVPVAAVGKPKNRDDGEAAGRGQRDSSALALAAVLPAEVDEGLIDARRADEPGRPLGAVVEDEQLPVLAADGVGSEPDAGGHVEPPARAAAGGRDEEVVVDGDEGGVLGED